MLEKKHLGKIIKLYIKSGFDKENRRRIKSVLDGDYKPLRGMKGNVYLIGHRHASAPIMQSFVNDIINGNRENINSFLKSIEFTYVVEGYKKDIRYILDILENNTINCLFTELEEQECEGFKNKVEQYNQDFTAYLTAMGCSKNEIDLARLYYLGPSFYLYVKKELGDVELKGVEGNARKNYDKEIKELFSKQHDALSKVNEYLEENHSKLSNQILYSLSNVTGCDNYADPGKYKYMRFQKLLDLIPMEIQEDVKLSCNASGFFKLNDKRDKEMVDNVVKKENSIVIVGAAHYSGLKNGLEKKKFRVK